MAAQLAFKLCLEIEKALETTNPMVVAVAVAFTIGWVAIIALCIAGLRAGYWLGAIWGLLHSIMTVQLPMTRIYDHYVVAAIVVVHGILIAVSCLLALMTDARKHGVDPYRKQGLKRIWGFILLCASTLARTLWITFREPIGAARAQAAMSGKNGIAGIAAASLTYVVFASMIALSVIIVGIVMKRRWAYASAAIFGIIHAVLTMMNVIFHVNQGLGPIVVIPASLSMAIGGIWMLRSISPDEKPGLP
jgi:hypothetical protein